MLNWDLVLNMNQNKITKELPVNNHRNEVISFLVTKLAPKSYMLNITTHFMFFNSINLLHKMLLLSSYSTTRGDIGYSLIDKQKGSQQGK